MLLPLVDFEQEHSERTTKQSASANQSLCSNCACKATRYNDLLGRVEKQMMCALTVEGTIARIHLHAGRHGSRNCMSNNSRSIILSH